MRNGPQTRGERNRRPRIRSALLAAAAVPCALLLAAPVAPAATQTFSNPGTIDIPSSPLDPHPVTASPYPSEIAISGLPAVLQKATVTLHGYGSFFPADVDVLVVAPGGQAVLLMSHVPNTVGQCGANVAGLTLTFDDDAAGPMPGNSPPGSGTYLPTDLPDLGGCGNDPGTLPPPAPSGPYLNAFSPLIGSNPNGTWSLYVIDDTAAEEGEIANGWSVTLTATDPPTATHPPTPAAPTATQASDERRCRRLLDKLGSQTRNLWKDHSRRKREKIKDNRAETRDKLRGLDCSPCTLLDAKLERQSANLKRDHSKAKRRKLDRSRDETRKRLRELAC